MAQSVKYKETCQMSQRVKALVINSDHLSSGPKTNTVERTPVNDLLTSASHAFTQRINKCSENISG